MRARFVVLSLAAASAAGICACGSLLSVGDDDVQAPVPSPVEAGASPVPGSPDASLVPPEAGADAAAACVPGPNRFCTGFDTASPFDGWSSNPGNVSTTAALFLSPPNAMFAQVSNSLQVRMVWKTVDSPNASVRAKVILPSISPTTNDVKLVVIKCHLLAGDIAVVKVNKNLGATLDVGLNQYLLGTLATAKFSTVELSVGSGVTARIDGAPEQRQPRPMIDCTNGLEVGLGVDPAGLFGDVTAVVDDVDISWD